MIELGLDTFGDITLDPQGGSKPHAQVIRDLVEEGVLADEVGIDFIGIGEHHRADFAVSSPETVLAAIAARTSRIRLGSAVTVLSSDDPIRVFQRFSTVDAISSGRAEIILGRGSFTESFPLFGLELSDYETLFEDKLDLFSALGSGASVRWSGRTRPPLTGQEVHPQPQTPMRSWIGVGGTPQSVIRAVRYEMPMLLAIIGGDPARFKPLADLYRGAYAKTGKPAKEIGVHSHGHVGRTDDEAREEMWPGYKATMDRIGGERGWPPMRREAFIQEIEHGSLYVGSPETVARKIAKTAGLLKLDRFQLKYSGGAQTHKTMMECIRLYGTQVAPIVRDLLA